MFPLVLPYSLLPLLVYLSLCLIEWLILLMLETLLWLIAWLLTTNCSWWTGFYNSLLPYFLFPPALSELLCFYSLSLLLHFSHSLPSSFLFTVRDISSFALLFWETFLPSVPVCVLFCFFDFFLFLFFLLCKTLYVYSVAFYHCSLMLWMVYFSVSWPFDGKIFHGLFFLLSPPLSYMVSRTQWVLNKY